MKKNEKGSLEFVIFVIILILLAVCGMSMACAKNPCIENLDAECIAHGLVNSCDNFICDADVEYEDDIFTIFFTVSFDDCHVVDCSTLGCVEGTYENLTLEDDFITGELLFEDEPTEIFCY